MLIIELQVLFVDYGNVAMLSEERCAQLPPGLANISACAFACCLDKIKPLQGARWGTEASQVIDTLTQQKGKIPQPLFVSMSTIWCSHFHPVIVGEFI